MRSFGSDMSEDAMARLERLNSMLKRRGIILPAFEIHGGAAGMYDFGAIGGRLRNRVNQMWLEHWLSQGDVVEINCPTITPYSVLEASGHVGEFSDFLVSCSKCDEASRADHLLEPHLPNPDSLGKNELSAAIVEYQPECPSCHEIQWGEVSAQNLMFNTTLGAGSSGRQAFIRPETAQGMFTNFQSLYRHFRQRLPFGAVQIGKGYRNEISPRQGMIRLREFNMAELEYFIDPEVEPSHDFSRWKESVFSLIPDAQEAVSLSIPDALDGGMIRHPTVAWFMARTAELLLKLGIDGKRLRFRQHKGTEMAHYASDCWDAEIEGSYGWVECVGIAHRGCYDLEAHENHTGQRLKAWRGWTESVQRNRTVVTIDGATAGPAFRSSAGDVKQALEELAEVPSTFPFMLKLHDGESVEILKEHIKVEERHEVINGEWFTPHVVEPAFGIDRIIWHLLDHAWTETEKNGEPYSLLALSPNIAPIDVAVLPLMEKDGMDGLAKKLHLDLCSLSGILSNYDASGSIGRRYARADEIGVPWCVTIDHQSLDDGSATVRNRDDQEQIRVSVAEIPSLIQSGGISERFSS